MKYKIDIKGTEYVVASKFRVGIGAEVLAKVNKIDYFSKVIGAAKENAITCGFIFKYANEIEKGIYQRNCHSEKAILSYLSRKVRDKNIGMTVLTVEYSLRRDKLRITFYSENRIDFRDLAKELAMRYKTRIDFYQVSARLKSQDVAGVSVCGQELCCSRMKKPCQSVSIAIAKNQNLALNPAKINGCCNRLKCCLKYENDTYTELREGLPEVGDKVECNGNCCCVRSVNVIEQSYIVEANRERIKVYHDENSEK